MRSFDEDLRQRLAVIREQGLFRELRRIDTPQTPRIQIGGKIFLNFSSNDYLGLANEPSLKEAAIKAIEKFGTGSGASRLICGSLAPHHELEEALAAFKKCEGALSFSSGYAAAVGTICALLEKDDILILDKLVHASIVDAARLCGAKLRVFAHNDLEDLDRILRWAAEQRKQKSARVLIVTESIFSMDGDAAPLRELVELKNKFGAWLMVDEAHATGFYGKNRRGLAEELGVAEQIEIQMGTLGKALGSSGGYICGSRNLIEFLINRARSFIFSTAPVPAAAAAAARALRFVQSEQGKARCEILWQRIAQSGAGLPPARVVGENARLPGRRDARGTLSAIIPIIIGDETKTIEAASALRAQGIFVPAIRYPTVARGSARLRVTLTAAHLNDDINALASALSQIVDRQS